MRIVVGVDRSQGSRAALRFALDEAAAHSAELVVVHAWEERFESAYPSEALAVLHAAAGREAAELVQAMVAEAQADRPLPVEPVVAHAAQGEAAEVLLEQAGQGDRIVVGANETGLVRRLVLGSVCARVVQAARCPVTVVPPGAV